MNKNFIKSQMNEEQLQKWLEERRKRFPTKAKRSQMEEQKKLEQKQQEEKKPNKIDDDKPKEINKEQ